MRRGAKRRNATRRAPAVACIALAGFAVGCGGGEEEAKRPPIGPLDTYVGKVNDSNAFIALMTDGDRLSGYLNDGKAISIWFAAADVEDSIATLATREGAILGEVSVSVEALTGQLELGNEDLKFEAALAKNDAGLFTAAERTGEDSFQAGWIVLPDGSTKGMYDTFIGGQFSTHPAPQLRATVDIPAFGPQVPMELTGVYFDTVPAAP